MSKTSPAQRASQLRWASVGLLWSLVVISLVVMWRNASAKSQAEEQAKKNTPNESKGPEPEKKEVKVTLQPTNANEETKSLWDENGIEDFEFISQTGDPITKENLMGQPWVVSFIFTNCKGPCVQVTQAMKQLQDIVQTEAIRLVTITVDPKKDTPEVLAKYAEIFEADTKQWTFLTGDQSEIYDLIHQSFKMPVKVVMDEGQVSGYDVVHTSNLLLVNAEGVVIEKYNSLVPAEMTQLQHAIRKELAKTEEVEPNDDAKTPEG